MKKSYYDILDQMERILNKAKGQRFLKLRKKFDDTMYPNKCIFKESVNRYTFSNIY